MTELYYFDSLIESDKIREYTVSTKYSEIRIGNKTVKERIQNLFRHQELKMIDNPPSVNPDTASNIVLVFSSSVFAKDLSFLSKFLKFSSYSMINTFWGHKNCFIYKGSKDRFVSYLMDGREKDIYFVKFPDFILDLTSLPELKSLLSNSHDSRHFNDIKSVGDLYLKKSTNSAKLRTEYEFLKHVPKHLQKFFVEVFEFKQEPDFAEYSMVSYDYKDVANQYLTNSLTQESFQLLLTLIQHYFEDAKRKVDAEYSKDSFNSLLKKNAERLEQIKKLDYYEELNSFIENHKGISITDHHTRIEQKLKTKEKAYKKEDYIFSHGDLCFSNILFSPQNKEIKLIDPKGYENKGMRSPYYDMAKLSHSIYGKYDLIINNMVEITFDNKMKASLDFSKFDYLKDFNHLFDKLVSKMKLDMELVRLTESSLFLSMIPFHFENKRKAFRLCMRSMEIFEETYPKEVTKTQ